MNPADLGPWRGHQSSREPVIESVIEASGRPSIDLPGAGVDPTTDEDSVLKTEGDLEQRSPESSELGAICGRGVAPMNRSQVIAPRRHYQRAAPPKAEMNRVAL